MTNDQSPENLQPGATEPDIKEPLFEINQVFTFEEGRPSISPRLVTMSAQLKNYGPFKGIASTQLAEKVHRLNQMGVYFEIEVPPEEKGEPVKDPTQVIFLGNLTMWAYSEGRTFVSSGRTEPIEGHRREVFDQWYDVTDKKSAQITQIVNRVPSEPLTIPQNLILEAGFKFSRETLFRPLPYKAS